MTYKIIRHYHKPDLKAPASHLCFKKRIVKTNLTLKEAQNHCNDPETSSRTCTTPKSLAITKKWGGDWFDGYEKE